MFDFFCIFFFSSRRRHTRCALVTGVQTCALPIHINDEFTASLVISRCHISPAGGLRWKVRFDSGLRPSITIVARMQEDNAAIHDYYLLPWLDVGATPNLRLAPENGILLDAYRFDTLEAFFDLTRRVPLTVAA